MKLSVRQLDAHLRGPLAALYAVHGAEPLVALEAADRIREAARKAGCAEREVFYAEPGVDWAKLDLAASNLSLFASKRMVELRIPTGKPGAEGGRAIEAWCAKVAARGNPAPFEDVLSLIILPELEWQSLKTQWFAALDRSGVVVEAKAVGRDELPDWLAERLSRQGQRASVETLEWLADRVEGNLLAARQEIEKLALLAPKGEITLEAIGEAITDVSRFERDSLTEAIHAGDRARIARVAASLKAEGEPLPLALWTLTEELRLAMAISAGQRPRRFLTPERTRAIEKTAKRHTAASFDRELLRAHRIDRMIKGVETGDPWESILELAFGIAGASVLEDMVA